MSDVTHAPAVFESSLRPGERLVWCDRSRELPIVDPIVRAAGFDRHALGLAACGVLGTLAIGGWLLVTQLLPGGWRPIFAAIPFAIGVAIAVVALVERRRVYAATSAGRGLVLARGRVLTFWFPPREVIAVRAAPGGAVGDLDLGVVELAEPGGGRATRNRLILRGISYPGAALDAIGAVALRGDGGSAIVS
jgi:hypothetical protein